MATADPLHSITRPGFVEARRQVLYELISGLSGLLLALFMWGHMVLVGSILTGRHGFDWMAAMLERYYIAQPAVVGIFALFLLHALFASRKIPANLRERRELQRLSRALQNSGREPVAIRSEHSPFTPHLESMLWIWQVRTGVIVLVLGSFHIVLLALDVLTPLFGVQAGIESLTSIARVSAGLWLPYAVLLICVEFHASVGLYRLAVKWGAGSILPRRALHIFERILCWGFLGLGLVILLVLADWLRPPLAFLIESPH